jgi:hypothetical protein
VTPAIPDGLGVEVDNPEVLEDPEVVELLARANAALGENPLHSYVPHERQRHFHEQRVKTKVFTGGNRSGKSTATVLDCLIQALDRDVIPDHLLPYRIWGDKFYCRFVTPDYLRAFQSILETIVLWCPSSQMLGGDWEKAFNDKAKVFRFSNGNFFEFLTLEQDPKARFGGSARHRVVFDEEPAGERGQEIREQCAMRLADFRGDELFGFTPLSGDLGWVFDEFWETTAESDEAKELAERVWLNEDVGVLMIQADIDENPHLSPEGREEALAKIPLHRRAAIKSGEFKAAKGLVYDEFESHVGGLHVVDERHIEPELVAQLEHLDGIDPGQVETAVLFSGIQEVRVAGEVLPRLVIYDELTLSGKAAVPDHAAEQMATLREGWGLAEVAKYNVIDPAAKSRSLDTGERVGEAWIDAGIPVIYGQNDLEAGVLEVKRRMNHMIECDEPCSSCDASGLERGTVDEDCWSCGGTGRITRKPFPLIVISSRCTNLIRQKRKYRQKPKDDGSYGVVKDDDHACDVERYLAMERRLPVKRKRRRTQKVWVPGTAAPFKPDRRRRGTVMGKYT